MAEFDGRAHISTDDLSAYADGQIVDPAERRRIEQHLEVCAECRDELRQLQSISQLLADLPEPELPRSFRLSPEDIPAAAEPTPIEPWLVRHQAAFRAAAMAAVLVLMVVVSVDLLGERGNGAGDEFTVMMDADAPQEDAAQEHAEDRAAIDEEDQDEAAESEEAPVAEEDSAVDGLDSEDAPDQPVDDRDGEESAADVEDSEERVTDEDDPASGLEGDREDAEDGDTGFAADDIAASTSTDDGPSTLRIIAIGLGVISIALLTVGFVIPRWWSASARRS